MTFSDWLNRTSMNSFRSFVISMVTTGVVVYFCVISGMLMLDKEAARAKLSPDAGIRASAQTSETSHHSYGMQLATAILTLLGAAIGINAAAVFGDRVTAKEHVEAKERGRVAGTAAAAVAAKIVADAGNGKSYDTKERAALTVEARDQSSVTVEQAPPETAGEVKVTEVAQPVPRQMPTGNALTDDESGS